MLRFLIDECCTPEIVAVALARGFHASHVSHMGLAGTREENLLPIIVANDFSFITNNRGDFLRVYRDAPLHAGLLVIVPSVPVAEQCRLMDAMLDAIEAVDGDIVNCLIEVHADGRVDIGPWPMSGEDC